VNSQTTSTVTLSESESQALSELGTATATGIVIGLRDQSERARAFDGLCVKGLATVGITRKGPRLRQYRAIERPSVRIG
jgi:hypothetical protein